MTPAERYRRDMRIKSWLVLTVSLPAVIGGVAWVVSGDCRWLVLCLPIVLSARWR